MTDCIAMKLSVVTTRTKTIGLLFVLGCTIVLVVTTHQLFMQIDIYQQNRQEDALQSFLMSSSLLPRKQPFTFDNNNNNSHDGNNKNSQQRQLLLSNDTAASPSTSAALMVQVKGNPIIHQQHQQQPLQRTCTSPERNVPWIFGHPTPTTVGTKSCRNHTIMVQSRTSDRRCGYCPDDFTDQRDTDRHNHNENELKFIKYLHTLSQQLRIQKEDECSSLLVYGVAFGEQYTHWLTRHAADPGAKPGPYKMDPTQVQELIKLHGSCFITFVLAENLIDVPQDSSSSSNNNKKGYYYSNDGLQLLVPIQRTDLPYTNMRRNTKIFKMLGPSYIFGSWVSRVVWQDAKLVATTIENHILPNNYYDYFFNVIHMSSIPHNTNSICASFMGLPFHKNTMGTAITKKHNHMKTVQFAKHCEAIIEASKNRPSVSDDLHSVEYQCSTYYNESKIPLTTTTGIDGENKTLPSDSSLLDSGLIDSAFIIWDLRSEKCQNFIATISCTWFDEIHCYSDRDQVSFPYIFFKMGLQLIPTDVRMNYHYRNTTEQQMLQHIVTPETHHRLFAHYSTPFQPMVHISKSSCHWYSNNNLNDCDVTQNDPKPIPPKPRKSYYLPKILRPPKFLRKFVNYIPPNYKDPSPPPPEPLPPSPKVYKLAIIVTGSFHRLIFQSSIQRFIQSLSSQGHYVDYYLSLSMNKAPAYRSDQNYMNYLVNDPIFNQYIYQNDTDGIVLLEESLVKARIRMVVQQQLDVAGANLRYMTFQDNYPDMNRNRQVIERRQRAKQAYPNEDPDLRFPTLDIRDEATMNRTANANRNMLNLFYHMQHLYQQILAYEMDIHLQYDYVLFLRDDTMWLQNFDFRAMIESASYDNTTGSNRNLLARKSTKNEQPITSLNTELFVPSCDARIPSMHPAEINDHIAIVKRNRAGIFGNYFHELFQINLDKCAQRLDDKILYARTERRTKDIRSVPVRGCNSEMILNYILELKNVTIAKVGQGQIPFQRMALVRNPITSEIHICFHKYCQSSRDPLTSHTGFKKCKDLAF